MKNFIKIPVLALLFSLPTFAATGTSKVVLADNIEWGYLNPLRGALSPGAVDLWGNRTTDTATGMLVRFNKGFESPPHIHNITYRGIVINGLMHNDAPNAEKRWMPTGSFWTQPAGGEHTTAANGATNVIYLEIDSGPYLVKPSKESFDNNEHPLNLHTDNIVWLNKSDLNDINVEGVESTYLWGDISNESSVSMRGSMIKLPAGFNGKIVTKADEFRAVVISGVVNYSSEDLTASNTLSAGSYFESANDFTHEIENKSNTEAVIYIRTNKKYRVN
ncbi:DUF4437 domain-containing protein [Marinomonas sp. 2405UD68-3]|uniref:DUF4437 domain-containing protein n=1 Tax=Marinomonas sp. 2405UD68-3 TaxID=3391835 RepID=UPI0039C99766